MAFDFVNHKKNYSSEFYLKRKKFSFVCAHQMDSHLHNSMLYDGYMVDFKV